MRSKSSRAKSSRAGSLSEEVAALSQPMPGGALVIYKTEDEGAQLDVRLHEDTVWLSQAQMSSKSNVQNLHIARSDKPVALYSLDVIISVGYRVKSRQGTQFRQWATRTLRDHLVKGYTLNQKRFAERGLTEARQTLDLLARTLQNQSLVDDTGRAVLRLIVDYADTWRLLFEYDEGFLIPAGRGERAKGMLQYPRAWEAITQFKRQLIIAGQASPLFAQPRGEGIQAILGGIEQTMFGEPLYRSREEKAAHLLYLVIKDHPFVDGNKRVGAFLFMLYLQQEGISHQFNASALTALALLVAESLPASKDLMIRLILSLLF